jgi:hypothetical protein
MRGHEVGGLAGLDGGFGQGHGKMRLADAGRPLQDHVGSLMHKPQGARFVDLPLVDGWLKAEIELLECFQVRQVRQLQSGLEVTLSARVGFGVHHFGEEIGIGRFLLGGGFQQRFEPGVDGGQAQCGECRSQLFNRSHRTPPQARLS